MLAEVILKEGKYDDSKMHRGKKDEHISPSTCADKAGIEKNIKAKKCLKLVRRR